MKPFKICLDAGHYGKYNHSPAVDAYYESDMNWKLHLMLKVELEKYGIEVITTRENQETDKPLFERGAMSEGCDLFLSIHSNAVGDDVNEEVDHPISIVQLHGRGDELGMKLAQCIAALMQTRQEGRIKNRRGENGEYYGVLRGAAAVDTLGIIIEHSFHTNTRSTIWLLDDNNLKKVAVAEAKLLAEYFNII